MNTIPHDIAYYCKIGEKGVREAWPVDPSREKPVESAQEWASHGRHGNYSTGFDQQNIDYKKIPPVETVQNDPIYDVKIIGLEQRANGGRAYKVVLNGKFLVDLREDSFMNIILDHKIEKGKIIGPGFVWMKYASQIKLVMVGGDQYNDALKLTGEEKAPVKVKTSELVPGKVYGNNYANSIFLGFARNCTMISNNDYRIYYKNNVTYDITKSKKVQVWLDIPKYGSLHNEKDVTKIISGSDSWNFDVTQSMTMYPAGNEIYEIPEGWVEMIRSKFEKRIRNDEKWELYDEYKFLSLNLLTEKLAYFDGKLKTIWEAQNKTYKK